MAQSGSGTGLGRLARAAPGTTSELSSLTSPVGEPPNWLQLPTSQD